MTGRKNLGVRIAATLYLVQEGVRVRVQQSQAGAKHRFHHIVMKLVHVSLCQLQYRNPYVIRLVQLDRGMPHFNPNEMLIYNLRPLEGGSTHAFLQLFPGPTQLHLGPLFWILYRLPEQAVRQQLVKIYVEVISRTCTLQRVELNIVSHNSFLLKKQASAYVFDHQT